jgi:hypothetical protein
MNQLLTAGLLLLIGLAFGFSLRRRWRQEQHRRTTEEGYQNYSARNFHVRHSVAFRGLLAIAFIVSGIAILLGHT